MSWLLDRVRRLDARQSTRDAVVCPGCGHALGQHVTYRAEVLCCVSRCLCTRRLRRDPS